MRYLFVTLVLSLNPIWVYSVTDQHVEATSDEAQGDPGDEDISIQQLKDEEIQNHTEEDKISPQSKASVLKKNRHERNIYNGFKMRSSSLTGPFDNTVSSHYFHMDPVLNEINTRRKNQKYSKADIDDFNEKLWMEEWNEMWNQKKLEASKSMKPTGIANIVAARPSGVPCGDPMQFDMPWGTCTPPSECDGELRIYRGDTACGSKRDAYVCCSVQFTNYNMYNGLDASLAETEMSSDEENKYVESKERRRLKRLADKRAHKIKRRKIKSKIKWQIRKVILAIGKVLHKAYRNGTANRHVKARQLKKLIEKMKEQYRKDRKSIVSIHHDQIHEKDAKLMETLRNLKNVNEAFMSNDTFRDIIVNGTSNTERLHELLSIHPEMSEFFKTRRMGGVNVIPDMIKLAPETDNVEQENPKALEYDLEFGMLYY